MAGASITLQLQIDDIQAATARLRSFMVAGFTGAIATDVGEYLSQAHYRHFEAQASPTGTPWEPLSPRYAKRKAKTRPGAPMLVYDNFLRGQLHYQVAGADTLLFGTSRKYGAAQHFGYGGIPARPWLGVSAEDETEIGAIWIDHLARAARGG